MRARRRHEARARRRSDATAWSCRNNLAPPLARDAASSALPAIECSENQQAQAARRMHPQPSKCQRLQSPRRARLRSRSRLQARNEAGRHVSSSRPAKLLTPLRIPSLSGCTTGRGLRPQGHEVMQLVEKKRFLAFHRIPRYRPAHRSSHQKLEPCDAALDPGAPHGRSQGEAMFMQALDPLHNLTLTCLVALIPVVSLLILLAAYRWPAWLATLVGSVITFVLAAWVWRMPLGDGWHAYVYGAATGVWSVDWITVWGMVLFNTLTGAVSSRTSGAGSLRRAAWTCACRRCCSRGRSAHCWKGWSASVTPGRSWRPS